MKKLIYVFILIFVTATSFTLSYILNTQSKVWEPIKTAGDTETKIDLETVNQHQGSLISVGDLFDLQLSDNSLKNTHQTSTPYTIHKYETVVRDSSYYSPEYQELLKKCETKDWENVDMGACEGLSFKSKFLVIRSSTNPRELTTYEINESNLIGLYVDSQSRKWQIYRLPQGAPGGATYIAIFGEWSPYGGIYLSFSFSTESDKYIELFSDKPEQDVINYVKGMLSSVNFPSVNPDF